MGNFCDSFFKPMPILPQEEIVKSPKNDNSVKSNHDQKTPLNTSTSSDEFFDGHEIQETIYLNKPTKKKPTINDFALVRPIGKGAFGKVIFYLSNIKCL